MSRSNISEAVTSLINSRVFSRCGTALVFNKNYEEWLKTDAKGIQSPRLNAVKIQCCLSSKIGTGVVEERQVGVVEERQVGVVEERQVGVVEERQVGVVEERQGVSSKSDRGVVEERQGVSSKSDRGRARALYERPELNSIQKEEEEEEYKEKQEKEKSSSPDSKTASEWSDGIDPMAPNVLTPEQSAEMRRAINLCDELFPMLEDVKRVVSQRQGKFPPEWYTAALRAMSLRPTKTWRCHYLLGILKNYVVIGGPDSTDTENTPLNQTAGIPRKPDGRESVGQKIDRIHEERIRSIAAQAEKLKARYSE